MLPAECLPRLNHVLQSETRLAINALGLDAGLEFFTLMPSARNHRHISV